MCEQLHWWQCSPSLMTWLQRQKSVSLSPSANGPLVGFFWSTHLEYIFTCMQHLIIMDICSCEYITLSLMYAAFGDMPTAVWRQKIHYVATKVVQGVDLFKMITQRVQSSDLSLLFMTIFPQQKSTKCKISAYFVKYNHYLMNYIYFI